MAFADRLKELRTENALSMNETAQLLGVAVSTYHHWENGKFPRPEGIRKIATTFNVTPRWLETGQGEKKPDAELKRAEEAQKKALDEQMTVYSKESEEQLKDVVFLINSLKNMDIPKERKRHIHRTLSGYRTDLENIVLFGEMR